MSYMENSRLLPKAVVIFFGVVVVAAIVGNGVEEVLLKF